MRTCRQALQTSVHEKIHKRTHAHAHAQCAGTARGEYVSDGMRHQQSHGQQRVVGMYSVCVCAPPIGVTLYALSAVDAPPLRLHTARARNTCSSRPQSSSGIRTCRTPCTCTACSASRAACGRRRPRRLPRPNPTRRLCRDAHAATRTSKGGVGARRGARSSLVAACVRRRAEVWGACCGSRQ